MSEMENTSDTVARLLKEIEQHVATINCAKVELRGQPDKLGQGSSASVGMVHGTA